MTTATRSRSGANAPVTKIYRLALYGRKSSGKTCILAALAMDRILNSEGFTCTWLRQPPQVWLQASAQAAKASVKDVAITFEAGRAWLEDAIRLLEHGKTPPGNPNKGDLLRFAYEFTADDHRIYRVELVDYSGELIDPALDSDISPLAAKLRQHMKTMDGILVLAEAPAPNRPMRELHRELRLLREAFAALRGEDQKGPAFDTPVVLLINKWDRRPRNQRFTAERGQGEVQDFFEADPEPPHRTLAQALKNSVNEGDFRCCPMSAFGHGAVIDGDGSERPRQVEPLLSYGLEDGFVWVARQRDQIDIEKLEQWTAGQGWWKLWQMGGEAPGEAANLPNRFPKGSKEKARVKRGLRRAAMAGIGRACLLLGLLAATAFGVEVGIDYQAHRAVKVTLANPGEADAKQLDKAEGWLEAYARSPSWRHTLYSTFSFSRNKALEQVTLIRQEREDQFVERVRKAPRDQQEALAREMLKVFPNSRYLTDLQVVLAEAERQRKVAANSEAITQLDGALQQLISGQVEDQDQFLVLQQKIDNLPPHKDAESDDIRKARTDLLVKLNNHLADIARLDVERKNAQNLGTLKSWEERAGRLTEVDDLDSLVRDVGKGIPHARVATKELQDRLQKVRLDVEAARDRAVERRDLLVFKRKVQQQLDQNDLKGAARALLERRQTKPAAEVEELVVLFRDRFIPKLTAYKTEQCQSKLPLWDTAKSYLRSCREDPSVQTLLSDQAKLRRVQDLEAEVDDAHDLDLYSRVFERRDKATCDDYLNNAPKGWMKGSVSGLKDHLVKMEGPLDLTLELSSIYWGNCWNGKNNAYVKVNDGNEFSASVESTRETTNTNITSKTISVRLSDEIKIWGGVYHYGTFSNSYQGTGEIRRTVRDMIGKEQTIFLGNPGYKIEMRVRINEATVPQAPVLPGWNRGPVPLFQLPPAIPNAPGGALLPPRRGLEALPSAGPTEAVLSERR